MLMTVVVTVVVLVVGTVVEYSRKKRRGVVIEISHEEISHRGLFGFINRNIHVLPVKKCCRETDL